MPYYSEEVPFKTLLGKLLTNVKASDNELIFWVDDGSIFTLCHQTECCELVTLEDVTGELSDLVGSPILHADESTNRDDPKPASADPSETSHTWSFYKLATVKGWVDIRWYGASNGYYSETASLFRTKPPKVG